MTDEQIILEYRQIVKMRQEQADAQQGRQGVQTFVDEAYAEKIAAEDGLTPEVLAKARQVGYADASFL